MTRAKQFLLPLPSLLLAWCLARGGTGRWRLQELELKREKQRLLQPLRVEQGEENLLNKHSKVIDHV